MAAAADAERALEILRGAADEPYDLALVDFDMPGLNGLQLAAEIRAEPAMAAIVLALLTSSGSERTAAREAGFRLYLTKPVRQETLKAALVRALSDVPALGDRAAVTPLPRGEGATILVAEDNPVNQIVARRTLEKLGFAVEIAGDGRQAVAMSAQADYAAIFMDCQMPRVDGYSATAEIREREAGGARRVPIVAMTANALKGDRERCLAAGMDDYLTKPLEHAELRRVLAEWVRPAAAKTVVPDESAPHGGDEQRSPEAAAGAREPAAAADDWLDPAAAARLRAEHSEDTLRALAALFAREAPARLADLTEAARTGDPEPLWQAAHRLKSSCRIVGAVGMEHLCQQVEANGREGRADACRALVARLEAAYPPVASALQRQLD